MGNDATKPILPKVGMQFDQRRKKTENDKSMLLLRLPRLLHGIRFLHTVAISAILGLLYKLSSLDIRLGGYITFAINQEHMDLDEASCQPLDNRRMPRNFQK